MQEIEKLFRRDLLFNYTDTMNRIGYTQEDINKVRNLIEKDEMIPKFVLNSLVRKIFNK
jgi:hypothetical protein